MPISNPGVPVTRQVIAGANMTGGGPLSGDVTLNSTSTTDDTAMQYFGDGSDGDLVIVAGVTKLTKDMYYNNLTINGTGQLNTAGFHVFVNGILDISAAPALAIYAGPDAGAGRNGTTGVGGASGSGGAGTLSGSNTLGANAANGGNGATGGTGAGAQGTAATAATLCVGGPAGASGKGGTAGANAGGASRPAVANTSTYKFASLAFNLIMNINGTFTQLRGGGGGGGGGAGGGDGAVLSGGGGGAGAGGGVLWLAARTINRSAATAARAISAKGGNGGDGNNGASANNAGGGGGPGAGGGWCYVIYQYLTGALATDCIDASGGDGGAGSVGRGTGLAGDGGGAGGGGKVDLFDLGAGTHTTLQIGVALAGNAAVGAVAGAVKAADIHALDL